MKPKAQFKNNEDGSFSDDDRIQNTQLKQDPTMWTEIKPQGKNVLKRSYHSCVIWNSSLFIYGGYEQNLGILSDFHSIAIYSQTEPFSWKDLSAHGQPGPLRNHQAIVYNSKMYILGGLQRSLCSTGSLWVCDLPTNTWQKLSEIAMDRLKFTLEGHSSVLYEQEGKDPQILTYGGFYASPTGGYSSSVLSYNIVTNQWQFLFEDFKREENNSFPTKRAAVGLALAQDGLYVFGGTNVHLRYDDFWRFDLIQMNWEQIKTTGFCPESRSSPSLIKHPDINGLLLFGGIHDITHEKNDLCIFDLDQGAWKVIEEDNSHNVEEPSSPQIEKQQTNCGFKKKTLENSQNNTSLINMTHGYLKSSTKSFKPYREYNNNLSSTQRMLTSDGLAQAPYQNNMEESKKKRWQQMKMNMLSEFELNELEKNSLKCSSPTTDQMKNSISQINKRQDPLDTKQNKKDNVKFTQQDQVIQLSGKKPCARDGHTTVVFNDKMIVFGGDRHLMSFSDIYVLQLSQIKL